MRKPSLVLALLSACHSPETPATSSRSVGEEAPVVVTSPAAPACSVAEPTGAPPSILAATWPERAPGPPSRDAHGRRVIVLDETDGYGPLHVVHIDAAGHTTDLGEGSDPRLDGDAIVYLEHRPDGGTSLVRVLADGTVERRAGGTGAMGGLGSPLPRWRSPFTRDGRFMAFARGCEEGELECAVVLYDHVPWRADELPIDRLELSEGVLPREIALSHDGDVVIACGRFDDDGGAIRWMRRSSGARGEVAIEGRCLAISPSGDRALVARWDDSVIDVVALSTGDTAPIDSGLRVAGAAFDVCGDSVIAVGVVPAIDAPTSGATAVDPAELVQRVVRGRADGSAPSVLLETRGEPELSRVEIDARGWALIASDEPGVPARAHVISIAGGTSTDWTVPGRVYDVALGP